MNRDKESLRRAVGDLRQQFMQQDAARALDTQRAQEAAAAAEGEAPPAEGQGSADLERQQEKGQLQEKDQRIAALERQLAEERRHSAEVEAYCDELEQLVENLQTNLAAVHARFEDITKEGAAERAALLEAIRGDLSGGSGTGSSDDIGSEGSDVSDGEGGS